MQSSPTFTETLGIAHPIIQAPMAGISTPVLAAAVSNAGGLGSLGLAAVSVEQAAAQIRQMRELTDRPFNVNFFCHQPAIPAPAREAAWLAHLAPEFHSFGAEPPTALREIYRSARRHDELLTMLLDQRPAVVSFHFGLPDPGWVEALRDAGIYTMACATHPDEARLIEAAGFDAVIAQGIEAGGHRGIFDREIDPGIGTIALTRMLATGIRLPVIAAGGIMDGAGIDAALRLGASAAQLGTAFVLCPESSAGPAYRAQLKSERALHTGITAAISGRPARGLVNRLHEVGRKAPPLPDYSRVYDAGKALHQAASAQGNHEYAAHWAGQGAPLAREMPAADLVAVLVEEWRAAR